MSKSEQKRINYQKTGKFDWKEIAASNVCDYLRDHVTYSAEIDADEEEIVRGIIDRVFREFGEKA